MIGRPVNQFSGEAEEGVKWWFHQIDRGINLRKEEETRWEHNESFEDLKQWDGELGRGDETTINKVGSWIRTHRAAMAYRNPKVKVTPKSSAGWKPIPIPIMGDDGTPEIDPMTGQVVVQMVERHKVREALINDIISAPLFGLKKTLSRVIKAGALGYGVVKVGYRPIFETEYQPDKPEQMVKITGDGLDFSEYVLNPVTGMPAVDDEGNLISRASIPAWEDWFIDWVHYRHMIIDPDGGNDFMKHAWVAHEYVRSLEDVKNDSLLENTKDLEATGDFYRVEDHTSTMSRPEWLNDEHVAEKAKQVRLFEIWDLRNERLIILADGYGKYLRNEAVPRGTRYSPFVFYRPNEVICEDEKFYPRPPVSDLAPINDEYNKARRQQLVAMKKSNRKVLIKKGALDTINITKLINDRDMEIVEIQQDGAYGIGDSIMPYTPPPVSDTIYANIAQISRDFDEVAGQPGESRGVASSKTATQVNNMSQYAGVRLDFDRMILADMLREAMKKLSDSIEANMTVERAVSILGPEGQTIVGIIDPDMIIGDFDVDIDIEDMMPVDSAQQAALKIQFAQVAGQSPWLVADETLAMGWGSEFGVKDMNFLKALSRSAQMQMQMMMAPEQPKVPNAPPPQNEADAIAQMGAGMQAPNMQGAP